MWIYTNKFSLSLNICDNIVEEIVALEEFIDCEHAGESNLIDCILGLREVLRDECVRRLSCVSHNCK